MATCKDCIHYEACKDMYVEGIDDFDEDMSAEHCKLYKNKADFVEVVRCEDCLECKFDLPTRENGKSALDGWYCKLNREYVNPEAFCSYGKRKETTTEVGTE